MRPSSNNQGGLRSFIALELPLETRSQVAAYCRDAGLDTLPGLRMVRPEQLHLTLHFLGNQPAVLLRRLADCLHQRIPPTPVFPLTLRGLGVFPRLADPRVLWLGFEPSRPLLDLHRQIGNCLAELAIVPDRKPFRAHLTLARIPAPLDPGASQKLAQLIKVSTNLLVAAFDAYQVVLFKSELKPNGPAYTALSSHALTDAPPSGMV